MNILIVDDRPANLKLLRAVLEAEGTTVCEAVDGLEALGVLQREHVDAIISDILMPRMDGYRLCMEVRANRQFCDLPFIAYTATYTSDRDEKLMTDIGADRFLRKPASAALLTATLENVIQAKRHHPPSARARPEAELLKEYNERLVAKLEEKTIALESKNERLTRPADKLCTAHGQPQHAPEKHFAVPYRMKWEGETIVLRVDGEHVKQLTGPVEREPLGYADWIGQIHPDDRAAALACTYETLAHGTTLTEFRLIHHDGSVLWIEDRRRITCDPAGEPLEFAGIWTDITARRQTQSRLALHHALAAVLAEDSPVSNINQKIIATLGASLGWDFGELWINDRSTPLLRCTEIWHRPFSALHAFASERQNLTFAVGLGAPGRIWASGRTEWYSEVLQDTIPRALQASPEGLPDWIGFPIVLRQEVVGVVGFFRRPGAQPDAELLALFNTVGLLMGQFIERQQLAEELRQVQKMAAIGTLAGGIAHDFNNILGGIYGYCELARMEAMENLPVTEHLDAVMNGARRATDLVQQILSFSRQRGQERQLIQLRHITAEAMRLLRAAVPPAIEFSTTLADDVPVVLADETQVHQILMNLGTNAAHAMREHGGRLTVHLENCHIAPAQQAGQSKLHAGQYARLTISDTGHGMNEQTVARIFEPFFTTKPPGDGVGLGLAVVRGIVNEHQGAITVSSRCGEGTTFQVYFPAHPVVVEEVVTASPAVPHGSGERILFVDDEPSLADLGKLVLDRIGYVTDICSDGRQALELVLASPEAYALVIADQMMPVMTGTDLAQGLATIRPNLPIIIATGCPDPLLPDRLRALGVRQLLRKPLSARALALAAHQVLSTAATPPVPGSVAERSSDQNDPR